MLLHVSQRSTQAKTISPVMMAKSSSAMSRPFRLWRLIHIEAIWSGDAQLYLLYMIKSYIASSLLAAIVLAYIFYLIMVRKKNIISLALILFVVSVGFVILTITLSANMESIIEDSKANIEVFKGAYISADEDDERSMAGFKGVEFEITFSSLLARSPLAIFSTLFRPFLWESNKLILLFSSLESFLILIATI
jgi:hypothetical protein